MTTRSGKCYTIQTSLLNYTITRSGKCYFKKAKAPTVQEECMVCYTVDNKSGTRCNECHHSVCIECTQRISKCPFCRTYYSGREEESTDFRRTAQIVGRVQSMFIMAILGFGPPVDLQAIGERLGVNIPEPDIPDGTQLTW
jgi:hypothetical protein